LRQDKVIDLEKVCALLESHGISKSKWPEDLIIVDEMPLTPTRKVIKGKLTEHLR